MIYGYARVSTRAQHLDAQIEDLKKAGCKKVLSEKLTGTKAERPEFQKLLAILAKGDTLTVTKLDRFAQSTSDALTIIKPLFRKGVRVNVLNMGIIEDTPTGRLTFTIFCAFAEFERDLIVTRTQEGKEIAKQRSDFREGRPKKFNRQQIELALSLLDKNSYTKVSEMTGISKSTLARANRAKQKIIREVH
ncbi:recombinase family protein [Sporolactobacillus shoreae]|uniref:Recombinase family protein n=1 Tax=Sporolactobacillus shoreae TaxID=1465501 RepID=A0A4Z0GJ69_9BACL|nr:recombinase family protein [Sporolactobacillus shoreae]TGA96331.1 recombinase family protein [Sporolactobacillus shoreae]